MLAVDVIVFTGDIMDDTDDVGAVSVNGASPTNFAGIVSVPSVESILGTSSIALTLLLA
jgi:hypothetical protein